ncbi:MAG TPA: glycosyltransferase family 4 protein [bacterium]|nr:glycosyltransferase family 4 protein [bacterium]
MLFLSQSCPYREGGMETRSREIAVRIAGQGHQVTYLCAKTRVDEKSEERRDGLRILRKKILPDFLLKHFPFPSYFTLAMANWLMGFYLWRFLRRESFDAIREEVAPVPVSGIFAFTRLKTRRVAVIHGLPVSRRLWIQLYGRLFGLYGYAMERALRRGRLAYDGIVAPANWYAESLRAEDSLRTPVFSVPNGVDLKDFKPAPAPKPKDLLLRLLCVGRLAPNKGHRYLLEGLARAQKSVPGLRLTILGQGNLEPALRRQARHLGIERSVDFAGYIPESDLPAFYRSFDLLVMPSLLEGFNIVLLEAMAVGLPVLVSDIPGFRDVADEATATFFAPADPSDLARKLIPLAGDPEGAEAMALRGLSRIQGLSWDEIASLELSFLSDEPSARQSPAAMRA